MSACKFCGPQFDVTGKFCPNCGKPQEGNFDDQQNLQQFAEIIQDSFFEIVEWQTQVGFLKSTQRIREKLLISHATSIEQFNNLKKYLDAKQPLSKFQLEFNQNVIDAYAGHDTYLQFRFTNNSDLGDSYKVYIFWDDRETEDDDDLHIKSNLLIKPNQSIELGGTHIFMRAGPKEISELTITVANQFKDEAKFKVTPFNFRVKTPTQNVINQITTKNEISIEGRGVVDAANMGGHNPVSTENNEPQWINLEHFLLPDEVKNTIVSNPSSNTNSKNLSEEENNSTQSNHKLDNGDLWSGELNNAGLPHGKGTYQVIKKDGEWAHDDLEFYIGEMQHGEMYDLSGKAEIKYRSGADWYVGTVIDGKPHGWGHRSYCATEGNCYRGMFFKGMRHGLLEKYHLDETAENTDGIMQYVEGEFIQGESWAEDSLMGTGYYEEDPFYRIAGENVGGVWLGTWFRGSGKENFRAGWNDVDNEKNLTTVGYKYDGMLIYGLNLEDGSIESIYNGDLVNNRANGFGIYFKRDYSYDQGNWVEGKPEGNFNTRDAGDNDPSIYIVQWKNGTVIDSYEKQDEPIEETNTSEGNDTHEIFDYPVDPVMATIWNHCYFGDIYEVERHYWDYEWWNFLGHDLDLASEIESGGNGRKVITEKIRKNVKSQSSYVEEKEQIVLVYDDTVFGSCKDFVLFTNKSFWVQGINQKLEGWVYSHIKKAEPTGKNGTNLKLYLSDNTTYITNNTQLKANTVKMHSELLNKLAKI